MYTCMQLGRVVVVTVVPWLHTICSSLYTAGGTVVEDVSNTVQSNWYHLCMTLRIIMYIYMGSIDQCTYMYEENMDDSVVASTH